MKFESAALFWYLTRSLWDIFASRDFFHLNKAWQLNNNSFKKENFTALLTATGRDFARSAPLRDICIVSLSQASRDLKIKNKLLFSVSIPIWL